MSAKFRMRLDFCGQKFNEYFPINEKNRLRLTKSEKNSCRAGSSVVLSVPGYYLVSTSDYVIPGYISASACNLF